MKPAIFKYRNGKEEKRTPKYFDNWNNTDNFWETTNSLYVYNGKSWIFKAYNKDGLAILVEKHA